jgi:benzoylformate decarboxylase
MPKMKGAEAFLRCLKTEGIKYIFGNPGTTEVALLDALCAYPEITYVLTLQESVAVGMADGYARGGGEIGIVNVHTGVGTANTIGGIYGASIGKLPILIAIANKDTRILGRSCFSEVPDLPGLTRQFTKWSWDVRRADRIPEDLLRGIKTATTFPRGPVFLSFSEDLLIEQIDVNDLVSLKPQSPLSFRGNEEEIRKAAQLLLKAKEPLLIAGTELAGSEAFYEAVELAELLGMPVMTEGRDSLSTLNFPHAHPSFRHEFDPDSPYVKKADVILGMGCKLFVELRFSPTPQIPPDARIIHFSSDPYEMGKLFPEEISVLCDGSSGIKALLQELKSLLTKERRQSSEERMRRLAHEKEKLNAEREKEIRDQWDKEPIHFPRFMRELNQTVDQDAILVDESVQSSRAVLKFYEFAVPGTYHRSSAGALGWGVPSALGMKLANPRRQVIVLVGDGAFLYSHQSLWTAARYNIPVMVVVCNNRQYRAVKDACRRYDGIAARTGRFIGSDLRDPDIDFCRVAEGFGVWAKKIIAPHEIKPYLREALHLGKPALLDLRIE